MSLFDKKNIKPMLIGADGEAFDSPDWIYELKLDGERGIVYLDPQTGTELRNKRNKRMLPIFPELSGIHRQVKKRCILDGEYVALKDGKPCFSQIQRRSLMTNRFKIQLAAEKRPISFVAFDILYLGECETCHLPLLERKALLQDNVNESSRVAVSRYIVGRGKELYNVG